MAEFISQHIDNCCLPGFINTDARDMFVRDGTSEALN
jgi:hypothetical protein